MGDYDALWCYKYVRFQASSGLGFLCSFDNFEEEGEEGGESIRTQLLGVEHNKRRARWPKKSNWDENVFSGNGTGLNAMLCEACVCKRGAPMNSPLGPVWRTRLDWRSWDVAS